MLLKWKYATLACTPTAVTTAFGFTIAADAVALHASTRPTTDARRDFRPSTLNFPLFIAKLLGVFPVRIAAPARGWTPSKGATRTGPPAANWRRPRRSFG